MKRDVNGGGRRFSAKRRPTQKEIARALPSWAENVRSLWRSKDPERRDLGERSFQALARQVWDQL